MLGSFFEAMLLIVNGLAVLQDYSPSLQPGGEPVPRFLAKMGWTTEAHAGYGIDNNSVKSKLIQMVNAVRTLLRVPLIFVNILAIIYLVVLG